MVVIVSIISLIAIVSLYDYLTARRWQQVTSSVRNDIVFANRNKAYGAYVLRNGYDTRMVFILIGIVLTMGVAYGSYLFVKANATKKVDGPAKTDTTIVVDIPKDDVPPPPPPDVPPPPPVTASTAFIAPEPSDEHVVEEPLPTQEELDDKPIGPKDEDGEESFAPPVIGDDTPETKPEVVETKPEPVEEFVEEEAEFIGGYATMMKYIQEHLVYPQTAIEMNIQGRVQLRFVVEKDGRVSNVTVLKSLSPECDKEAIRVLNSMPAWKPGKISGRAVRQWCTLPINFTLN